MGFNIKARGENFMSGGFHLEMGRYQINPRYVLIKDKGAKNERVSLVFNKVGKEDLHSINSISSKGTEKYELRAQRLFNEVLINAKLDPDCIDKKGDLISKSKKLSIFGSEKTLDVVELDKKVVMTIDLLVERYYNSNDKVSTNNTLHQSGDKKGRTLYQQDNNMKAKEFDGEKQQEFLDKRFKEASDSREGETDKKGKGKKGKDKKDKKDNKKKKWN